MGAGNPSDKELILQLSNREVGVRLSEHARARRISLRVDPIRGCVVLVKPRRTSKAAALAFAEEKSDWIADRLAELTPPVPFIDGAVVPVLGQPHLIRHCPEARRGVWRDAGVLNVSGTVEHLSRRVHDWFKDETRRVITPIAHAYAKAVDKRIESVSVRDNRSRWGSCTAEGRLSFSWRLLMTPPDVINYVVAHEVAHLCELNHSPRFWKIVDRLIGDRRTPTGWLKEHGGELHRYGLNAWSEQP